MDLSEKVSNSTKWAFITEVASKVVTPLSNMILARILAPNAFGILASIQIVLSFADMLADAGFQKYIVQKEFRDDDDKNRSILVAIYTNVLFALLILGIIFSVREQLACMIGNPGLGNVLVIAALSIPIVSFTSVQLAVMRRDFEFKQLMLFRMITAFTPMIITVPLAYIGYGYWALIIGMLVSQLLQAIAVFIKGKIHLEWYYSISKLKEMLSFSIWVLLESFFIWLTAWADSFIVSSFFTPHYMGIYKMSGVSVNALLAIVTGSVIPVLYSALSRLQNDDIEYNRMFYHIQNRISFVVIPLGAVLFAYKDLARQVLFGAGWQEAELVIGMSAITSCLMIVYGHTCSEVYRSKGRPRISTLAQFLHLIVMIPIAYYYASDFNKFVIMRHIIRLQFIVVHFVLLYYFMKMNSLKMLSGTWSYLLSAGLVCLFACYSREVIKNVVYDWVSMIISVALYLCILWVLRFEGNQVREIVKSRRLF